MEYRFIIRDCNDNIIGRPTGYRAHQHATLAMRPGTKARKQAEAAFEARCWIDPRACTLYKMKLEQVSA
jgi:hypothetical protein